MRSVAVVEVYRDVAQVMAGGCELADESLQCRSDGCVLLRSRGEIAIVG